MSLNSQFKDFITDLKSFLTNDEIAIKHKGLLSNLSLQQYEEFGLLLCSEKLHSKRSLIFINIDSKNINEEEKHLFLHSLLNNNITIHNLLQDLFDYILNTIPKEWIKDKQFENNTNTYLKLMVSYCNVQQLKKIKALNIDITHIDGIPLASYLLKIPNFSVERLVLLFNADIDIFPNKTLWNEFLIKILTQKNELNTPIFNINELEKLEKLGFKPDKYNDTSLNTPLHYLLDYSYETKNIKINVKSLIEKLWIYHNQLNVKGITPLFKIFENNHFSSIPLLESVQVDFQQEDSLGNKAFDSLLNKESMNNFLLYDQYNCLSPLKEDIKKYINNIEQLDKVFESKKYEDAKQSVTALQNLLISGSYEDFEKYYATLEITPIESMIKYRNLITELIIWLRSKNILVDIYQYKLLFNIGYFMSYVCKLKLDLDLDKSFKDKLDRVMMELQVHYSDNGINNNYANIMNVFLPFENSMLSAITKDYNLLNDSTIFYQEYRKWYELLDINKKEFFLIEIATIFNKLNIPVVNTELTTEESEKVVKSPLYTEESYNNFENFNKNNQSEQSKKYFTSLKKVKTCNKKLALAENLLPKIQELYEKFPHFREVIEHIENHMLLQNQGDKVFYIPPMLLAGGPGVGKTFFTHTIANIVGTYFHILGMESVTAGFVISGLTDSFGGAQPGAVFNAIAIPERTNLNPIILLDELDKTTSSDYFPVANCLLPLLEKYSAKKFKDECIPIEIDASNIIWIATANELNKISAPLKSRMDVFHIPNPTIHERKALIKGIYEATLKNNSWGSYFNPELTDEILVLLANMMTTGAARDLRRIIVTACAKAIKDNSKEILVKHIDIDKQPVKMPWDLANDHQ